MIQSGTMISANGNAQLVLIQKQLDQKVCAEIKAQTELNLLLN